MDIFPNGTRPSGTGPPEWFTGQVRTDPLIAVTAPSQLGGVLVTFDPGARTNWHTHPLGQTLIVTQGKGRVQRQGGPVEEIFPGDVIRFGPGERHWHGAGPTTGMAHIALHEALDGVAVDWAEPVADNDYAP